jgi:hypothetical protein
MNSAKKEFLKIGATLTNLKFETNKYEIELHELFDERKNTRGVIKRIPISENELHDFLKDIGYNFTRTGSIWIRRNNKNYFYSMEWFRNQLKKVPLELRSPQVVERPRESYPFKFDGDVASFTRRMVRRMNDTDTYYITLIDEQGDTVRLAQRIRIMKSSHFDHLYNTLDKILQNKDEYNINTNYIIVKLHKVVNENSPLTNQRDGEINCACKIVLNELEKHQSKRNEFKKKNIMKINKKYLETGIDDEGLQLLADKSYFHLIIYDKSGNRWREFIPRIKGHFKKLLLLSHNNHISNREDPYDSDDNEDQDEEFDSSTTISNNTLYIDNKFNDDNLSNIEWYDDNKEILDYVYEYEKDFSIEGTPIISKGNLIAYITPEKILKTKFYEWEKYPDCFTSGSVGKAKFIEQCPEYKHGVSDNDPFYSLLMDADRSGFYCRSGPSDPINNIKYDQNSSYKSFQNSGIFKGFPILEGVFKIDKYYSDLNSQNIAHGLLYIEWDRLTPEKLNEKIYYESSGWYPVEIVKSYYEKYNINPYIKSYAYAREIFNVDFTSFTNDQFRTFLGKCISQFHEEIWKTRDFNEFMRARYILKDRILRINYPVDSYEIVYESDKKPWNMPILSVYIKAHQKYTIFEQYNKLIENNIVPVAVNIDGIEVFNPVGISCDELFNMTQWKHEQISTKSGYSKSYVIERKIVEPRGEIEFSNDMLVQKFEHISGMAGNGKSHKIVKLAKIYPKICYIGPTQTAVKNLLDKAKQMDIKIEADTYHRVFGFGCEDIFNRSKYTKFILDECSMVSAENLKIMLNKLTENQSFIMAGDFKQLDCVEGMPIYKSEIYNRFTINELTKNWRQKEDKAFFDLCNMLRGKLSKSKALEILKKLNTRVVRKSISNKTLNDAQICGINKQVDNINKKYKIEVGCKVISNMQCYDKEKNKIPNNAIGIVRSMTPLKIEWEDGLISEFKGICKHRFSPAYGLTIHKAQGKTLTGNVIINPSRLFAKNHLYVALTRAIKFTNIFLTEKITYNTLMKTCSVISSPRHGKK